MMIVFHPLNREHISEIVGILFEQVRTRLADEGLTIKPTPAATQFLVDHGYDEHYGARPLRRAIQRYVEDPLSEELIRGNLRGGDIEVYLEAGQLAYRPAGELAAGRRLA